MIRFNQRLLTVIFVFTQISYRNTFAMSTNLNIVSWNVRGIMSSSVCLSNLLEYSNCDIAILSEHKLKHSNANYLDTIHPNYSSFVHLDSETSNATRVSSYPRFLGKGGISIMFKKDIEMSISEIPDIDSSRLIAVELKRINQRPLYIIGVYLPSENDMQHYLSELSMLETIFNHLCSLGDVILGGDFNASFIDRSNINLYKAKALKQFISRADLGLPGIDFSTSGSNFTFTTTKTTLDYIMCNKSLRHHINQYHVYEEGSLSSTSDHLPILMVLSVNLKCNAIRNPLCPLPAWHKAELNRLEEYKNIVSEQCTNFQHRNLQCSEQIEQFCIDLNSILHDAASLSIPTAKYRPYLKPEWTPKVKELHDTERLKRKIWLAEGRPRGMSHESYRAYKRAKRQFRNELIAEHDRYMTEVFRDIDQASECDLRLFWKLIKRQRPRNLSSYPEMEFNGILYDNPDEITKCFACHFQNIFNPVNCNDFDDDFFHFIEKSYEDLQSFSRSNNDNLPGGHITGKEIIEIVKDLKRRKAPGLDRIQNEHVIYSGPTLANCIAYLFNGIINAGQIPTSWKQDLIVPIFKGSNKPRNSPDSYRPIALLPCFLKIFEKLLLNRTKSIAAISATFPNLQQQGFQQRLGCITASFNLQETLYHFIEHRSTAYVAVLDTQKAFDTVWRHGLMYKLHKLGVKGRLWTLIDDCHVNTSCSVVSNQSYSDWFPVSQGVRQGGVLSTFLYLVFINDLLQELEEQSIHIGIYDIISSNPTLADDISLIALSPNGLQRTLEIAYDYSKRWRFNFDANKSSILRFHPSEPPSDFSFIWQLGAHSVHLAKTYNHLGILLHSKLDPSERTETRVEKEKQLTLH